MTLVVDSSAIGEYLLRTPAGRAAGSEMETDPDLHVPALHDLEVCSVLRRQLRTGRMDVARAFEALEDLLDLPLVVHDHRALLGRVLQLRENFSPYDAAYLALAESVEARLLTCDARFGRAVADLGLVEVVALQS